MKKGIQIAVVIVMVMGLGLVTGCGTTLKIGGYKDNPVTPLGSHNAGHDESVVERTPNGFRSWSGHSNDSGPSYGGSGEGYDRPGYVPDWVKAQTLVNLPPYAPPPAVKPPKVEVYDVTVPATVQPVAPATPPPPPAPPPQK